MSWCFAIINGKLGEIYFEKKKNGKIKFLAHCYVERREFETKQEQKWINKDTKNMKIIYRNKKYKLIPQKNYVKK